MIPFMDEQATHLFRMTGADLTQIDGIDDPLAASVRKFTVTVVAASKPIICNKRI